MHYYTDLYITAIVELWDMIGKATEIELLRHMIQNHRLQGRRCLFRRNQLDIVFIRAIARGSSVSAVSEGIGGATLR